MCDIKISVSWSGVETVSKPAIDFRYSAQSPVTVASQSSPEYLVGGAGPGPGRPLLGRGLPLPGQGGVGQSVGLDLPLRLRENSNQDPD